MPTESQSIFASLTPNDWGIIFTMLGVVFSAVLAGIGSAIGVGKAGQAAAGVVAEQPDRFGNCMVLQLLPAFFLHCTRQRLRSAASTCWLSARMALVTR